MTGRYNGSPTRTVCLSGIWTPVKRNWLAMVNYRVPTGSHAPPPAVQRTLDIEERLRAEAGAVDSEDVEVSPREPRLLLVLFHGSRETSLPWSDDGEGNGVKQNDYRTQTTPKYMYTNATAYSPLFGSSCSPFSRAPLLAWPPSVASSQSHFSQIRWPCRAFCLPRLAACL